MAFYNDGEKVQVGSRSSFRGARDQVILDERQRQNTVASTIGKSFYEEEDEDDKDEEQRQKQGTPINSGIVIAMTRVTERNAASERRAGDLVVDAIATTSSEHIASWKMSLSTLPYNPHSLQAMDRAFRR
ncbi:TPA: hypothetical protein N0F65_004650 [Lagenidium giganteum]|uniref:Uncharacterized protein n=1 Tax=Lagenidium giganteum TaxID=4803 RepID=A0AAV2Z7I4_9STRA|nr:TPA: hypothetical protein N0F65_004650 [Lagenidium giganteum]